MCIALWTTEHPNYALIICNNRDEFLHRPTQDAKFHSFEKESDDVHNNILSGIDIRAGGTWFGINRFGGKIALLTNITESPPPPPPPPAGYTSSRGYLTSSFLQSPIKEGEEVLLHSNPITNIPQDAQFSGFNLLLLAPRIIPSPSRSPIPSTGSHPNDPNTTTTTITFDDAVLVTNKGAGGSITTRPLTQDELRYGGLSNGIIDNDDNTQVWPKVTHGTRLLRDLISQNVMDETEIVNHLFEILSWTSPEPILQRSDLQKTIRVEPIINNINNNPEPYGTRLSTLLLIRKDGSVLFIERDVYKFDDETRKTTLVDPPTERVFRFMLEFA